MANRFITRRHRKLVSVSCFLLLFVFWFSPFRSTAVQASRRLNARPLKSSMPTENYIPDSQFLSSNVDKNSTTICSGYDTALDIVIVVKTGATEASRRFPQQLVSFLSCAKDDVLVFSDMEQWIGDVHIYDSLEDIAEEAKAGNADFKFYFDQKQLMVEGRDIDTLSDRTHEAWVLDKYKNIHTAQRSWALKPNSSWYFFIDADSYVVRSSLSSYLRQFNASKKYYLGAAVPVGRGDLQFAHGGSGYALSRATMEFLNGRNAKAIATDFDIGAISNCCGDSQMSQSLSKIQIDLTDSHPIINGDSPKDYRFGPSLWCQPLVTMHHIGADLMNDIWQFERSRKNPTQALLFEELWTAYLEPKLPHRRSDWHELSDDIKLVIMPAERDDWDNLSEDFSYEAPSGSKWHSILHSFLAKAPVSDVYKSVEKCVQLCKEMPECFQYSYSNQECKLQKSFRFGQMKRPAGNKRWKSGWDLDKINKFKNEYSPCKEINFTTYHQ